jgi:hypothetical protein
MGDRGCIVVKSDNQPDLVFYTHWCASSLEQITRSALNKVEEGGRGKDFSYFNRIVFDTLVGGDQSTIGYGIDFYPAGDAWCIVELDFTAQTVRISEDYGSTYSDLVSWEAYKLMPVF